MKNVILSSMLASNCAFAGGGGSAPNEVFALCKDKGNKIVINYQENFGYYISSKEQLLKATNWKFNSNNQFKIDFKNSTTQGVFNSNSAPFRSAQFSQKSTLELISNGVQKRMNCLHK